MSRAEVGQKEEQGSSERRTRAGAWQEQEQGMGAAARQ